MEIRPAEFEIAAKLFVDIAGFGYSKRINPSHSTEIRAVVRRASILAEAHVLPASARSAAT
jgi:hypothetical protein